MMPVAMAWSSSGSIVIRYVLPVLQMTSCFHTMGPMGGQTGMALCGLPYGTAGTNECGCWLGVGCCSPQAQQAGLLGRLGACWPGLLSQWTTAANT